MSIVDALFSLSGRVAVVTGASSGIGRALAEGYAAAGAQVVLIARRADKLDEAVTAIRGAGGILLAGGVASGVGWRGILDACGPAGHGCGSCRGGHGRFAAGRAAVLSGGGDAGHSVAGKMERQSGLAV